MRHRHRYGLKAIAVFAFGFLAAGSIVSRADDATPNLAPGSGFQLPLGIPADVWEYYVPKNNPQSESKVKLGQKLFFDQRLSADGTISCATCHDPGLAFADGKPLAEGIGGKRGFRNTPSILNSMFNSSQFWDGRAESLEAQAKMPLVNDLEMGNASNEEVVARLKEVPEYVSEFRRVFGGDVTIDRVAMAIAAFERTLVAGNSPFDRFVAGDRKAMSDAAQRGLFIFRSKGRCTICHSLNSSFPFLTDQNFRNTGVAANFDGFESLARRAIEAARVGTRSLFDRLSVQGGGSELGRFLVTGNSLDIGAYRTPSLRNVELTAPYFHDGSAARLADVVRFYVNGGKENPARDWELQPVALNDDEQLDLIEFLKALTSGEARATAGKTTAVD
jgi:cytochrome c peroxidase